MGSNRKDLLRECLIELNLEFDISFPYYYYSSSISILFDYSYLSIQICIYYQNESFEFVRLEELKEPSVQSIDGEKGYEW